VLTHNTYETITTHDRKIGGRDEELERVREKFRRKINEV